ncbi:helix-turn-helix domain-containing protein [uncultured Brevundimonas sp.]|jgi:transcriptional regulator with XRE-family HTH domain|uniref:helix-turn-helix domain-containing protein n=1 Tax=uncultured Brevundimonas sp. TaxID=213418 RepID=UPI00338D413E
MTLNSSSGAQIVRPTGRQLRAARALVGLTTAQLAEASGVSLNTIKRGEASDGPCTMIPANLNAITRALAACGARFIEPDREGGEGVRMV